MQGGFVKRVKVCDALDKSMRLNFLIYALPVILREIEKMFCDGGIEVSHGAKENGIKVAAVQE